MNWLAHSVFSPGIEPVRLGNAFGDLLRMDQAEELGFRYVQGVKLHRWIDKTTDDHPAFQEGKALLTGPMKRYAGAVLDIFSDHFLTVHWEEFVSVPYEGYLDEVYRLSADFSGKVNETQSKIIGRMISDNWLGSYADFDGIELTFERMSNRLRYRTGREIDLTPAVDDLRRSYAEFDKACLSLLREVRDGFPGAFAEIENRVKAELDLSS